MHTTPPQPTANPVSPLGHPAVSLVEKLAVPTPKPQHLDQFRALYLKRFGHDLSREEALQQMQSLLVIVRYRQLSGDVASQRQHRPHQEA